ncbi:methyltransferase domain-containing protein [Candidatus Woesearchaeota archaeon]|nr:methyltransferase domain-containing protein [Candidatus Woesearchaeota archaeon]
MANPYFDKIAWLYPIIGFLRIKNKFYKNIKKFTNPDSIVLDVGGGTGIIAELLVNDIKEITILDPSKNMLKKIKSKKIKKLLGSAENIKFKDKTFDLVYCVDSFHHFTNSYEKSEHKRIIQKCLRELIRILKPKGKLLIIEFDNKSKIGKIIEYFENRIMKWHSNFYNPEGLESLFKNYKTKIHKINTYCYMLEVNLNH